MALISLQEIVVAFGGPRIFDQLSLNLEPKERVALLGRNGTGKTTLMKVIAGVIGVDGGQVVRANGLEVSHLPQEIPNDLAGTIFDVVASGLGRRGDLIKEFHDVSHRMLTDHSPQILRRLDQLQAELDKTDGWDTNNRVEAVISQMSLNPDLEFNHLSGGQKRRTLLARALVKQPDILLLDEPTNHLDIESIDWLEGFLKSFPGTLLFVTHDRVFMQHLATRIVELDRGKIYSWSCDYPTFLERKQLALDNEEAQRANFDKKLAEEEVWIRKGVKARRTRNEGRVKALERMREERRNRRDVIGRANMQAQESDPSGHLVIKVSGIGFNYGDTCLIRDFSANIMRGDKIGIIGPNGSGKSTLLKILLERLQPTRGKVRLGTNLDIVYYDQLRETLDGEKTVIENVTDGTEMITINGKTRHVIGYLQDFLFTPERARTPVKVLSGGERNRLLLARILTRPCNLLVMDEPTNDLDIETLELLEELLTEYSGTLLLVSHDRAFLNNVVTSTIVLEGEGAVNEYAGGYDDWLLQRASPKVEPSTEKSAKIQRPAEFAPVQKLSFKEEKELAALPGKIEKLEAERDRMLSDMAHPDFYKSSSQDIAAAQQRLESLQKDLQEAYARWEELEGKKSF